MVRSAGPCVIAVAFSAELFDRSGSNEADPTTAVLVTTPGDDAAVGITSIITCARLLLGGTGLWLRPGMEHRTICPDALHVPPWSAVAATNTRPAGSVSVTSMPTASSPLGLSVMVRV